MDIQATFAISAAGMDLERVRYEVSAANLANANTVSGNARNGFQPLRVTALAAAQIAGRGVGFDELVRQGLSGPGYQIEAAGVEARAAHDPGHPLADASGKVYYPAVDSAAEMMLMMSASRAYEANVAALNTGRTMAMRALDIGSGG
ncbi:flagellar basal body rod protein FlgC [Roseateles sp. DAIF2]|uniref:flagellar basal body rod protein FlgC n=1 Tax=Roseateles sp. DAIF2 TaxID=2714952 RepID=UPI0018A27722|nr:flagellar basal body rod C-terminal domain-containing protein [Roseateles sp. DAIF2]QPF74679.1 flagellar basal body rod protein FlgC [Roseateles sp. DAIF2]